MAKDENFHGLALPPSSRIASLFLQRAGLGGRFLCAVSMATIISSCILLFCYESLGESDIIGADKSHGVGHQRDSAQPYLGGWLFSLEWPFLARASA